MHPFKLQLKRNKYMKQFYVMHFSSPGSTDRVLFSMTSHRHLNFNGNFIYIAHFITCKLDVFNTYEKTIKDLCRLLLH